MSLRDCLMRPKNEECIGQPYPQCSKRLRRMRMYLYCAWLNHGNRYLMGWLGGAAKETDAAQSVKSNEAYCLSPILLSDQDGGESALKVQTRWRYVAKARRNARGILAARKSMD